MKLKQLKNNILYQEINELGTINIKLGDLQTIWKKYLEFGESTRKATTK